MSEREQLIVKLRSIEDMYQSGLSHENWPKEAADLIESQAKELADIESTCLYITREKLDALAKLEEARARVVVLSEALERIAGFTPTSSELHAIASESLAPTDTAAQTLREKWTPVSERLPEPDTYVIVYNGKWCGLGKWVSGQYVEDIERWQDEHTEFIELLGPKISHWQPLPEPPKEKK